MTQVADWASKVLPHLGPEAGVQECILEPGEVPRFFASTSSSLSFCSCGSQLEFEAIMLHTINVIATQVIKMYLLVSHSFYLFYQVLYFPSDWPHATLNLSPYTAFASTFIIEE